MGYLPGTQSRDVTLGGQRGLVTLYPTPLWEEAVTYWCVCWDLLRSVGYLFLQFLPSFIEIDVFITIGDRRWPLLQGLANLFCKRMDSKYFRSCRPEGLHCDQPLNLAILMQTKQPQTTEQVWLCSHKALLTETRSGLDLTHEP